MNKSILQYHDNTAYNRDDLNGHKLDWHNQPRLVKEYTRLKSILLPDYNSFQSNSLKSILNTNPEINYEGNININTLSSILHLTYGVTAKTRYSQGEYLYRSAASAGALYPVEIYIMVRNITGIEGGIYHYNPERHSLSQLRKGDFSSFTGKVTSPPLDCIPSISFIFSALFFRSSWKYRDRAYRYHLLDTGHVLENLSLTLKTLKIPFEISFDFEDNKLNQLIGIDQAREAGLVTVNVTSRYNSTDNIDMNINSLSDEIAAASIVSSNDIDYPAIREMHEAGRDIHEMEDTEKTLNEISFLQGDSWQTIESKDKNPKENLYPECLFKRRSKRNFISNGISNQDFMSILDIICLPDKSKPAGKGGMDLLKTVFFADNVEGVEPGLYSLDRKERKFGIIRKGTFAENTAHICLDQEWLKNSGLFFLMISDLNLLEEAYGPRGYRYAMMDAGRIGERLYIAATSFNLGCCGIGAFYDNEASELLNLDANSRLLYLSAIGKTKS